MLTEPVPSRRWRPCGGAVCGSTSVGSTAGWRSLSHLRAWPVDGVVIDAALVGALGRRDRPEETLVDAIVTTAGSLGLPVEADGVAEAAQALRLRALGVDAARGPRAFDLGGPVERTGSGSPFPVHP